MLPSGMSLWASEGIRFANSSRALEAPMIDLILIQWPSSMTSIKVASSQKNTLPLRPNTTAPLYV